VWNKENRFTGSKNIPLSAKGREEARFAARKMKGLMIHAAFSSELRRAEETRDIIMAELKCENIILESNKALNEKNFGLLEGKNKDEMRLKYGDDKIEMWRKSFYATPPCGESLRDITPRVQTFYTKRIIPLLKSGKNVLLVGHSNSLKAIIMYVEKLDGEGIYNVMLKNAEPLVYKLDEELNVLKRSYL